MNKMGSVYAWVVVALAIIVLGIIIPIMWYVYSEAKSAIVNALEGMGVEFPEDIQKTLAFLDALWFLLPVLIIIGLIVWAYVYSTKREPYAYP